MKTFKKILCLIIALSMIAMLAGCGPEGSDSTPDSTDTKTKETDFSYSDGLDENGFWEGVKAVDYIELFDYKSFAIPFDIHNITEEALMTAINDVLSNYTETEENTERAIVDGDTVNIDYVGSVDGVEFENGSTGGEGTEVTIGVTNYIDDFLEQLIGHKPGEKFDIEVTFPEDYGVENLNGKDAVFAITVNYITEHITPELTDDFVKTNLYSLNGWETVNEFKAGKKEELKMNAIKNYIGEYLATKVTAKSVPEKLIEFQENATKKACNDNAEYYSITLEEYLQQAMGVETMEELLESRSETNKENAIYTLVAQAIAEELKLTVSDEDLATYFAEVMGALDYSEYAEEYGLPYLRHIVLQQNVIDYIAENAVLEEKSESAETTESA